jgi:hypothetical protein
MSPTTRKKRKKSSDEETIERLENEIRELKSLNRSLLRRLKKVDKGYYKNRDEDDEESVEAPKEYFKEQKKSCTNCAKGELIEVSVAGRKFIRCELCGFRSKAEKV